MTRILVVDDSETIRLEVGGALEEAGFEVVEACDGVEGLEKAQETKFHLVLLDVNMPRMDGMEMLDRIKEDPNTRDVPVVMLTTEVQDAMIRRAKKAGAAGWIFKPPALEVVVRAITRITGHTRSEAVSSGVRPSLKPT